MHFKQPILIFFFLLFSLLNYGQEQEFSFNQLVGKTPPTNSENKYKLNGTVYEALERMRDSALASGMHIEVISAFRTYAHQQRIWNRKFKRFKATGLSDSLAVQKILEYSTIPGTSRHHWGTDVDIVQKVPQNINGVLQSKHFESDGAFFKLKQWLDQHAASFGFHLIYTSDPERKGFKYEPWHLTFKEISDVMLQQYIEKRCFYHLPLQENAGLISIGNANLEYYYQNYIVNP